MIELFFRALQQNKINSRVFFEISTKKKGRKKERKKEKKKEKPKLGQFR